MQYTNALLNNSLNIVTKNITIDNMNNSFKHINNQVSKKKKN